MLHGTVRNILLVAVAVGGLSGAWGGQEGSGKPYRTKISEKPWIPAPAPISPKVIYGTDDRKDLFEETDPLRRTWAASTCGLLAASALTQNGNGTYSINASAYDVCPDEPFSNQPVAAFCTGFVVGDDIIATAGHCFDSGDLGSVRFVFGFAMADANTPILTIAEDQVYVGVEILGHALRGNLDYTVVRVDREITAPGVENFDIRREGTISNGENVGAIGHPSGLPLKLAFSDDTLVRDNSNSGFFVANLDTFGGNSGSPVINTDTGVVEGILVRGEQDFILDGNCRRSNVLPDSSGGEEVSKTTTFMQFIPELLTSDGELALDRTSYRCSDTAAISLSDVDLLGMGMIEIDVTAAGGDMESVTLLEVGAAGEFEGVIGIQEGVPVAGNGMLEAMEGETLTFSYFDAVHNPDAPDEVVAVASVDCTAPVVTGIEVGQIGGQFAVVHFMTDERASGEIQIGGVCGESDLLVSFTADTAHDVLVSNLVALTEYFFTIEVADEAGNTVVADNGGTCFSFSTEASTDYYTEDFNTVVPDLQNTSILFTPDESDGYTLCRATITELPTDTAGATTLVLADDGSQRIGLADAAAFPFYGMTYDAFYVNANGNITFGAPDSAYETFTSVHFSLPRVAPAFSDYNPSSGGTVSYRQFADRVVVTWLSVPHFDVGESNTLQVELYFDGAIRFSYLTLTARPVIVGLSAGVGVGSDFVATDFSAQSTCDSSGTQYHSADTNQDLQISLQELLRVIQFVNLDGYHCDPAGEDGYGPGPGDQTCAPHDIDYNPQDWGVSLSELLRLVQFFNAAGYGNQADSEDGFVPLLP